MSDVAQFFSDIIAGELDIYVITFTLVSVMVILLFLSFPMIVPLAVGALIGLIHFSQVEPGVLIQQMVTGISPNALIAVPMFILAADITGGLAPAVWSAFQGLAPVIVLELDDYHRRRSSLRFLCILEVIHS